MSQIHQGFFLFIPATIADDPEIDDSTAILFGRIAALANQKGYCWASDEYLANLTRVTVGELKKRIKFLEDKGYIVRSTERKGMKWDRKIYPIFDNKRIITKDSHESLERIHPDPSEGSVRSPDIDKLNKIERNNQSSSSSSSSSNDDSRRNDDGDDCSEFSSDDLITRSPNGQKVRTPQSDIFRTLINYPTEQIKKAIEYLRTYPSPISNPIMYIKKIIDNQHVNNYNPPVITEKLEEVKIDYRKQMVAIWNTMCKEIQQNRATLDDYYKNHQDSEEAKEFRRFYADFQNGRL